MFYTRISEISFADGDEDPVVVSIARWNRNAPPLLPVEPA